MAPALIVRILHLFANYKWTGPADPAIRCAAAQRARGADVVFGLPEWTLPGAEHRMAIELRKARLPVIAGLDLRKHFHVRSILHDVRALRRRLDAGEFDVVHTHLLADHLIAATAVRRSRRRPVLVRSFYEPTAPVRASWRNRVAMRYTDAAIAPTAACAEELRARFGLGADRVLHQDPPIDTARRGLDGDLRAELGLLPDDFVIGITARVQPHRRFDLLWQVCRLVADARPQTRLLLLGRGNERDTENLVRAPLRELNLQEHVVLPGYLYEPSYSLALRSLDAFLFLVPGSDGTCRAVREAMALALPIVTTRRGILPELCAPTVPGGPPCGIHTEESAAALATTLIELCDDARLRRALGEAALARVQTSMDPLRAADRQLELYEACRRSPRASSSRRA